ncbi:MAG: hypothetical protein J5613_03140 [Alphaproteobacteria bacterium]|nr:hypothetical protein [Alphaproteobacteria bacterium]
MKKAIVSIVMCAFCACSALAAGRGADAVSRGTPTVQGRNSNNVSSRSATTKVVAPRAVSSRSATVKTRNDTTRVQTTQTRVARTGRKVVGNSATRGAITSAASAMRPARNAKTMARAAANTGASVFDDGYEDCQAAYFTCMDQFCALQNDTYRRCICSSKLETVKARERALSQTSTQLQDFKDLNIDAILKTPAEVKAMLTASEGEQAYSNSRDKSQSMKQITAISNVLDKTRKNAMSTSGQLDAGGDIKQIWTTTDLISGANIANLTGESLYNAVHSQCAELVRGQCSSEHALNIVMSAYGMYIENDCATLLSALDKQSTSANTAIRQTNRDMMIARLENYDAHNSAAINECIAGVRTSLTADTACGENYVHCLDLTGRYLNRVTGEPIYTANFYELNDQVSLAGDVLTNATNVKLVAELNRKKEFAKKQLETCRDIADEVWDEFMRQAITEIYQGQQARIRQVKNECMDVVNQCYDQTTQQLRDYSNIEEQLLLGDRLELSEEMCEEKMTTCSNLYGGGAAGLQLMIEEMRKITDQKIAQNCLASLKEYASKLCRVPGSDTLHSYPYGCRIYAPGDILYATDPACTYINNPSYDKVDKIRPVGNPQVTSYEWDDVWLPIGSTPMLDSNTHMCWENRSYESCNDGYWLYGGKCYVCPDEYECTGGEVHAKGIGNLQCGNYIGSLYQKMVVYALQYCVRPSESNNTIPNEVLGNVNMMMDSIRVDMAAELAKECDRIGGEWVTDFEKDETSNSCEPKNPDDKNPDFYNETNASLCWGLCKSKPEEESGDSSGDGEGGDGN